MLYQKLNNKGDKRYGNTDAYATKFKNNIIWQGIIFLFTFTLTSVTLANPQGPDVVSGNISITSPSSNAMQINQSTDKGIINWQSFNISAQEQVHFAQPSASSMTLNRVNPTQGVSQIYGQLTANGRIILINPAGVYFGPGSYVNVAGLIAATANITDKDFLENNYRFTSDPNYAGSIINEGNIVAATHGLVALMGNGVVNKGMIQAELGHVVLASGEAFTMSFNADHLINFTINQKSSKRGKDQNGNELPNGITNSGSVHANGGRVLMTADAAANVLDRSINMNGIVEAKSVSVKNGEIIFSGGEGNVYVSGKVIASGKGTGEKGGKVEITGQQIALINDTLIDVSADQDAGQVLIGGDFQGKNPEIMNALNTFISPTTNIYADALTNGDGGKVIVWADQNTNYYGNIFARGGSESGDGGFVEVSGKENLNFNGKVNTDALNGMSGSLLLDPKFIIIQAGGGTYTNNLFANNSSSTNMIDPAYLMAANANITLQANTDIVFNDALSLGAYTLTAAAGRSILLKNNVSTTNALINLTANHTGALVAQREVGAGGITLDAGKTLSSGTAAMTLTGGASNLGGFTSGDIILNGNINSGALTVNAPNSLSIAGTIGGGTPLNGVGIFYANTNAGASNFTIAEGGAITSNGFPIHVIVNANTALGGTGGILLNNTTANNITTNGGTINLRTNGNGVNNITGGSITQASNSQITLNAGTGGVELSTPMGSASSVGSNTNYIQMAASGFSRGTSGSLGLWMKNNGIFTISSGASSGSINFMATGNIQFTNAVTLASVGSLNLTSTGGNITLNNNNNFRSTAGDINITAAGNYAGGINTFVETYNGNGNINVLAQGSGPFNVGNGTTYKAGSGNINLTNSGTGNLMFNASAQLFTTGNITVLSDRMGMNTTNTQIGGTALGLGNANTVTLAPYHPDTTIGVSGGSGTLQLVSGFYTKGATSTTLASNVIFGKSDSGLMTIASTTPAAGFASNNFSLISGAGINQTGDINLSISGSELKAIAQGLLTTRGITTANKNISLTSLGMTQAAGTSINAGMGNIEINAKTGTLTLNNNSYLFSGDTNASSGFIKLIADQIAFNATQIGGSTLNTGGTQYLTIQPFTNGRSMGINGGAGDLSLGDLSQVYAKNVEIGSATAGSITLGTWSPNFHMNGGNLTLNTAGSITQTGILNLNNQGNNLILRNANNVMLTQNNILNKIAGNVRGAFSLINNGSNALVVDDLTDHSGTILGITAGATTIHTLNSNSSLILNSGINANGNIILTTPIFINNAGDLALNNTAGHYEVWSTHPLYDHRGNLAYNFKQYDATYGVTEVRGSGNGFLYSVTPIITPELIGSVHKVYDANSIAQLAPENYFASGAIDGDQVLLNHPENGIYSDKNVGKNINVAVSNINISGIPTNGLAEVYGYTLSSHTANGDIGIITEAPLSITPTSGQSKIYGQNDSSLGFTFSVSGLLGNDILSGGLGREVGENAGSYAFNLGNLVQSNYYITLNPGHLFEIKPATLTITPDANQSKLITANDPIFTYTHTGLVSNVTPKFWNNSGAFVNANMINDSITGQLSRESGETVGTYAYNLGTIGVTPGHNYNYQLINNLFTIKALPATSASDVPLPSVVSASFINIPNPVTLSGSPFASLPGVDPGSFHPVNASENNNNNHDNKGSSSPTKTPHEDDDGGNSKTASAYIDKIPDKAA